MSTANHEDRLSCFVVSFDLGPPRTPLCTRWVRLGRAVRAWDLHDDNIILIHVIAWHGFSIRCYASGHLEHDNVIATRATLT